MLALLFAATAAMNLSFPSATRRLILNIGSNLQPIEPPVDDESVVVVAFEPIVASQIKARPRLYVVSAAVSDESGVSMMGVFNRDGQSSSLAQPARADAWNTGVGMRQEPQIVPIVPLAAVLAAIPRCIEILLCKTDMQGFDVRALRGAGASLQRVHHLTIEVNMVSHSHAHAQA
jgi:FkbM family methyltransferase